MLALPKINYKLKFKDRKKLNKWSLILRILTDRTLRILY